MTESKKHITRDGDRWDKLAWDYYRDVSLMGLLIESNPHAPITPVLPSGMTLHIPLIERPSSPQELPPWKR